jgi:hypothetical protein
VQSRKVTEGLQRIRTYLGISRPEGALDAGHDDVQIVTVQHESDHRYACVPVAAVKCDVGKARIVARNQSRAHQPIKAFRHVVRWCHVRPVACRPMAVLLLVVAHPRERDAGVRCCSPTQLLRQRLTHWRPQWISGLRARSGLVSR